MNILGMDEAGRGSVIGPLVVAGVLANKDQLKELGALGVRDSKQLTRTRRTALLAAINQMAKVFLIEIPVPQLDENLTQIELQAMAQIIKDSQADKVYLDLPVGPRAQQHFARRLQNLVGDKNFALVAENKADARYSIVSAASIVAKVQRDRAIEQLHETYGDFGWGYPGEPKTRAFLKDFYERHGRFPDCARAKWQTLKNLLEYQLDL